MKDKHIRAVIFDMDGLMLDSERVSRDAWREAGTEWGYDISYEAYAHVLGRTVPDAVDIFKGIFGKDFPFYDIRARRTQRVKEYYRQKGVPVKPGLLELLDWLETRKILKAVATSTDYEPATEKLTEVKLFQRMDAIVTGDQIKRGKPAPDIFLTVAEKLRVEPPHCLVLEDSEAGIRAAYAAGMIPVMVPDLKEPGEEIRQIAYHIADSLYEVRELLLNGKAS